MVLHIFDDAVERRMRDNDSTVTVVALTKPRMAHRLGIAIRGNLHVKKLWIYLGNIDPAEDVTLLLQSIVASTTLKDIRMSGNHFGARAANTAGDRRRLTAKFLASIFHDQQTNTKLCVLTEINIPISCLLVLLSLPLDGLTMRFCNIHRDNNMDAFQERQDVMRAFQMTSIPEIKMGWVPTNTIFFRMALQGLAQNATGSLLYLTIAADGLDRDITQVVDIFCNTFLGQYQKRLHFLQFCQMNWNPASLQRLAEALTNRNDEKLCFFGCKFDDTSFGALNEMFRAQPALELALAGHMDFPQNIDIIQSLLGEGGCKQLAIFCLKINGSDSLLPLYKSLQQRNCSLSKLSLHVDGDQFDSFCHELPKAVSLRHLRLLGFKNGSDLLWRKKLLKAVRLNRSLYQFSSDNPLIPAGLTESDKREISFCFSRNFYLPGLIQSTTPIKTNRQLALLPELLALGSPSDIFVALQRGSDSGRRDEYDDDNKLVPQLWARAWLSRDDDDIAVRTDGCEKKSD